VQVLPAVIRLIRFNGGISIFNRAAGEVSAAKQTLTGRRPRALGLRARGHPRIILADRAL